MPSTPPKNRALCTTTSPNRQLARNKVTKAELLDIALSGLRSHEIKKAHELPPNIQSAIDFFGDASSASTRSAPNGIKSEFERQFPRKTLSEISGSASTGRTSLALKALARATSNNEWAAWVEISDAFDPRSAAANGIDLNQILWTRAPDCKRALIAAEYLLDADNLRSIFIDLVSQASRSKHRKNDLAIMNNPSIWSRLRIRTTQSNSAVIILSESRIVGSFADFVFHLTDSQPIFEEDPVSFIGLRGKISHYRHKLHPGQPNLSWESRNGKTKTYID